MGTSIILFLNGFDFNLTWLCSAETGMEKARRIILKKTGHLYHCGIISESEYSLKLKNTLVTIDAENLKHCDLVVEAISESLAEKRKLFRIVDTIVPKNCILASNSSSFSPSELIPSEDRKDNFAGLHFFFPVPLKSSVELITNSSTSVETRESLRNFLLHLNKRPFCQDESNPFILNRLLLDLQAEAFNIISENVISVAGLDVLVKKYLFPTGVFEFFDHVGIDIMLSSIGSYIQYSSDREFYLPMIQKLDMMVGHNQLGIKTGKGFYSYKGSVLAPDLSMQKISISDHLRKKIVNRLRNYFEKSVSTVLESGVCSRAELAIHLQDYLGIDRDPVTFFPQ